MNNTLRILSVATAVATCTVSVPVLAQSSEDAQAKILALESKVDRLERELAEMKARFDAAERGALNSRSHVLESSLPVAPAAAPAIAAAASPPQATLELPRLAAASLPPPSRLPGRNTIGDEMTGVARADTAPPPNDPEMRGFIAIPGTETMVRFGGFAKINAIYDFSPAGNADKLVTATIPTDGSRGRNANLDANATRFIFEVRRPSSLGPLRFYLENDFYGGAGVTAFRLRQAHGQVGNLYGGYGYSGFTDSDAFPETLDDEGPGGEALLRVAALRKIWKLDKGLTATLSVEDPSSDITLPAAAISEQPMPDIVGAFRLERDWGHLQTSFVGRSIGYRIGPDDKSKFAFGVSVSGLRKVGDDFVMASFTYGDGVARYFNDLGGRGYDAVIDPDGRIRTLTTYGGYMGYTRHWNPRWRSSLVGGLVKLERDEFLAPTAFRSSTYGAANLILQASPSFSIGLETLYGRHTLQNGDSGDVIRLQTSLKYDFVR